MHSLNRVERLRAVVSLLEANTPVSSETSRLAALDFYDVQRDPAAADAEGTLELAVRFAQALRYQPEQTHYSSICEPLRLIATRMHDPETNVRVLFEFLAEDVCTEYRNIACAMVATAFSTPPRRVTEEITILWSLLRRMSFTAMPTSPHPDDRARRISLRIMRNSAIGARVLTGDPFSGMISVLDSSDRRVILTFCLPFLAVVRSNRRQWQEYPIAVEAFARAERFVAELRR